MRQIYHNRYRMTFYNEDELLVYDYTAPEEYHRHIGMGLLYLDDWTQVNPQFILLGVRTKPDLDPEINAYPAEGCTR